MDEKLLKVKACEHTSRTLIFASGEDAPGKSRDTIEQCNTCGAVIHDYRHNGGQRSPNYPIVRDSPLLKPFLAVCQQLIEAERALAGRGMSLTPDLDMIRLAKENERLRLDLDVADRPTRGLSDFQRGVRASVALVREAAKLYASHEGTPAEVASDYPARLALESAARNIELTLLTGA